MFTNKYSSKNNSSLLFVERAHDLIAQNIKKRVQFSDFLYFLVKQSIHISFYIARQVKLKLRILDKHLTEW